MRQKFLDTCYFDTGYRTRRGHMVITMRAMKDAL
jgi:hypothetical protein